MIWRFNAKYLTAAVMALSLFVFADSAAAANDGPVSIKLEGFKVVTDKQGKESLISAERAKPADTIEYQATYLNNSKQPVSGLLATIPVPADMEYLPDTANPKAVSATTDGTTFAPAPLMRKVRLPSGKEALEKVPYKEYRALRWIVGTLPAQQSKVVSARMRITPVAVQASKSAPANKKTEKQGGN